MPKPTKKEKLEEKKREAEKSYILQKKNELVRELVNQERCRAKIDQFWRHVLMDIKVPFLHEEVKAMLGSFDRVMDKKDAFIKELQRHAQYAEDQTRFNLTTFVDSIDHQIRGFQKFIDGKYCEYQSEVARLVKDRDEGMANLEAGRAAAEQLLTLLRNTTNSCAQDADDRYRGETVVGFYEQDKTLKNAREAMENLLVDKYTSIMDNYKDVLKLYTNRSGNNKKTMNLLKKKDNMMTKIICSQEKRMGSSQGNVKKLKKDLQMYDDGSVMLEVRQNFQLNWGIYVKTQERMNRDLLFDKEQFSKMANTSAAVVKWLEEVAKKGERIVTGSTLCRKLQTAQEKSCPDSKALLLYPNSSDSPRMTETMELYKDMREFWVRLADADIGRKSLTAEKEYLTRENHKLQSRIKEWIDDMKRKNDADRKLTKTSGPPVVVEASLAIKIFQHPDSFPN